MYPIEPVMQELLARVRAGEKLQAFHAVMRPLLRSSPGHKDEEAFLLLAATIATPHGTFDRLWQTLDETMGRVPVSVRTVERLIDELGRFKEEPAA